MTRLTQLSIKKFRNVAPTTLEFRPGINVLLGRNAAGKTTLLRLLAALNGDLGKALQVDELEMKYGLYSANLDIEHTFSRKRVTETALLFGPDNGRDDFSSFRETGSFVFDEKDGVLTRAELLPTEITFERSGKRSRVERDSRADMVSSVVSALFDKNNVSLFGAEGPSGLGYKIISIYSERSGRMDESLDRFNDLLDLKIRKDTQGTFIHFNWSIPHVPKSMQHAVVESIPEGPSVTFSVGFLDRVARVLGYVSAEARFDVERLNPTPDGEIIRLSNLRFFFKRPGEEISHELLSYGQKRLLAFFAHADASPSVVIADELVNGLHHEWISACLDEIGERQAFLTSQNPLLLDFLRFESADEVRRTFILCERVSAEVGARLIWRNPTVDEAESFFSAYQTGIQRVSDILLTKGLW